MIITIKTDSILLFHDEIDIVMARKMGVQRSVDFIKGKILFRMKTKPTLALLLVSYLTSFATAVRGITYGTRQNCLLG